MLFKTHILLGMAFFLITKNYFSGGNQAIFFLLVLFASIFPDIDEPHSKVNQWSGPLGEIVIFLCEHRTLFHAVILHVAIYVVIGYFVSLYYAKAWLLGYVAHIIGDGITPMGVQLCYPFSDVRIRGPVRVGGIIEWILFAVLFVLVLRVLV